MLSARRIRCLVTIAAVCVVTLGAEYTGLFAPWNRNLGDARMAVSPRVSDGQTVFVAVDARSLSEVGAWPWSRSVHAAILDRVTADGAADVLLDFDFTFPADAGGDRAFEDALSRAGGGTLLAAFAQDADASPGGSLHYNFPMPAFRETSWPALVNVWIDPDGLVRNYPFGAQLGDTYVSSAGALMAGRVLADTSSFEINFSIRPETIRVVSAIDVIRGNFPEGLFADRSVIVGASAIELSDQLAVPVHGVVPGPLIHAMAAETLARDLVPRQLRSEFVALMLLGLLAWLHTGVRRSSWLVLGASVGGIVAIELFSLALFRNTCVLVPSAMLYPSLIGFGFFRLAQALDLSSWLLQKADIEARNTLQMLTRVFEDSSDGIVILNEDGSVLRHSASAADMFGTDDDGRLRLPDRFLCREFTNGDARDAPSHAIEFSHGKTKKLLEFHATQSEVELPLGHGKKPTIRKITTLVFRDITKLKEQEQDIAYLSNYDERTGALRRGTFLAFLGLRLEERRNVVVFAVTLNRFKTINVTLGRDIGDALLEEVVSDREIASPVVRSRTSRRHQLRVLHRRWCE